MNIKNLKSKDSTLDEWVKKWKNENPKCEVLFIDQLLEKDDFDQFYQDVKALPDKDFCVDRLNDPFTFLNIPNDWFENTIALIDCDVVDVEDEIEQAYEYLENKDKKNYLECAKDVHCQLIKALDDNKGDAVWKENKEEPENAILLSDKVMTRFAVKARDFKSRYEELDWLLETLGDSNDELQVLGDYLGSGQFYLINSKTLDAVDIDDLDSTLDINELKSDPRKYWQEAQDEMLIEPLINII